VSNTLFCSYPFVSLSIDNNKEIGAIIPAIRSQACWEREENEGKRTFLELRERTTQDTRT